MTNPISPISVRLSIPASQGNLLLKQSDALLHKLQVSQALLSFLPALFHSTDLTNIVHRPSYVPTLSQYSGKRELTPRFCSGFVQLPKIRGPERDLNKT